MKMNLIILLAFFCMASCGSDNTTSSNPQDEDTVASDELNLPCIDDEAAIILPSNLENQESASQFEAALLVWSAVHLSNSFRESLSQVLLPPDDAVSLTVDNITINTGDKGFEWLVGDEKYVYVYREFGYQIYYYNQGDLAGEELIYVDQNEDCSSFEYIQYAIEAEGQKEEGDVEFLFNYQKAGTAKIVSFGTDIYDAQNEEYRLRSFEDLSGDLTIKNGGKVTQKISWNTDGSGQYQVLENGIIIEEGTWSF